METTGEPDPVAMATQKAGAAVASPNAVVSNNTKADAPPRGKSLKIVPSNKRKSTNPIRRASKTTLSAQRVAVKKLRRGVQSGPGQQRGGVIVKPRRYRPGTAATMEIVRQQKNSYGSNTCTIPKRPFQRYVREIAQEFKDDLKFQESAMRILHEASEAKVGQIINKANRLAIYAGRVTLFASDIRMAITELDDADSRLFTSKELPPMFHRASEEHTYRGVPMNVQRYIEPGHVRNPSKGSHYPHPKST